LLYVIKAQIDVSCLPPGLVLLIQASGSAEFATFRPIAAELNSGQQWLRLFCFS
jgi:hypothetical protein